MKYTFNFSALCEELKSKGALKETFEKITHTHTNTVTLTLKTNEIIKHLKHSYKQGELKNIQQQNSSPTKFNRITLFSRRLRF